MKEIHDEIFSSLEAAMTAANIYTTNDGSERKRNNLSAVVHLSLPFLWIGVRRAAYSSDQACQSVTFNRAV
jgi:hypothetical protein